MALNRTSLGHVDLGVEAGMFDEHGQLRPPLAPGSVVVPARIQVAKDRLVYKWDWTPPGKYGTDALALQARRQAEVRDVKDLLQAFMRIRVDRDIATFARRYGPLGLCERGFRLGDIGDASREYPDHDHRRCNAEQVADPDFSEPLSIWHRVADRTRAIFEAAAALHTGQPASMTTAEIEHRINLWLQIWRATPRLQWAPPHSPVLRVGSGAAEHLALQLAAAMTRTGTDWAVCDGCSRAYQRVGRAVQTGRRNWCSDCKGDRTMARVIKQAQRKRKGGTKNEPQG